MFTFVVFSILFAIVVAVAVFEGYKRYLSSTKLSKFVVINGLPGIGAVLDMLKCDSVEIFDLPNILMEKYNAKDERAIFTWMGPILLMYTDDADTYKCVLNADVALKKGFMYPFLRNTQGLLFSQRNIWKMHRKALNPTFGPRMVNTFIPIFNKTAQKMVTLMEQRIGTNVDMYTLAFSAAIDATFGASFGMNWSLQNRKGEIILKSISDVFERAQLRIHSVWMKYDFLYQFTKFFKEDEHDFKNFYRFIESALEAKKIDLAEKMVHGVDEMAIAKDTNRYNFLQKCLQLEAEGKFNDLDVCEEMQTILVGSTDTTAIVLSSTILMLAIHPEYQERVVAELRSIFKNVDDPVLSEHLPMMTTLELVIKEAMRLFPIGPYLARETMEDLPMNGGVIPKGTQIILNIFRLHRKEKYWGSNANEFYPERFLEENSANYHPYQYIPFSAGPRNCIGIRYAWANLKITLSRLLRRYKFTSDLKLNDVKICTSLMLKVLNKDPVRLEERHW